MFQNSEKQQVFVVNVWRTCVLHPQVLPALPSIVYGGAAVLASCFAFFLPETLNEPLPDTIEDVEDRW